MRSLAVMLVGAVVFASGCATNSPPASPQKHEVKIKVDKINKKTKIRKVRAFRKDRVEFQALDGTVTIIVPSGDLEVEKSSVGKFQDFGDWFSLTLKENETAVILVPDSFPDNRHDKTKKREIWYLVICGEGANAYPGESDSPPRIIIPPRPPG